MKLRIKGNSIRLRLNQTEVKNFGKQGKCSDQINFGDNTLFYSLEQTELPSLRASFKGDKIAILVPTEIGQKWVRDDAQVGFEDNWKDTNGNELFILVEKDFACLADRPREDESDNFPNPLAGEVNC